MVIARLDADSPEDVRESVAYAFASVVERG
jgi:hypothetical protein